MAFVGVMKYQDNPTLWAVSSVPNVIVTEELDALASRHQLVILGNDDFKDAVLAGLDPSGWCNLLAVAAVAYGSGALPKPVSHLAELAKLMNVPLPTTTSEDYLWRKGDVEAMVRIAEQMQGLLTPRVTLEQQFALHMMNFGPAVTLGVDVDKLHALIDEQVAIQRDKRRQLSAYVAGVLPALPHHVVVCRAVEAATGATAPLVDGAQKWTLDAVKRMAVESQDDWTRLVFSEWHDWKIAVQLERAARTWVSAVSDGAITFTYTTPSPFNGCGVYWGPALSEPALLSCLQGVLVTPVAPVSKAERFETWGRRKEQAMATRGVLITDTADIHLDGLRRRPVG